jgi:SPP1 gp7 family putative phage head morphogenesis protein
MAIKTFLPIVEKESDYKDIQEEIILVLKEAIYAPLVSILKKPVKFKNASDNLAMAIMSGQVVFNRGSFTGTFNSKISAELRSIGAKWDNAKKCYKLSSSDLPLDVRLSVSLAKAKADETLNKLDQLLLKLDPKAIAERVNVAPLIDKTMYRYEKDFKKTVESISVKANLTAEQMAEFNKTYTDNLRLYIADFVEKETAELRKNMKKRALSGFRSESAIQEIQKSYGVSYNKAKFLARQETSLALSAFRETRYKSVGLNKYKWKCVAGSPLHPVRSMHKIHDGKIFSWDKPPVVNDKGDRKNPGEDYNCRCVAIPIVEF